jgi:BTB/POZ domain
VSALSLVRENTDPQSQINPTISPPEPFHVPDANLVIRSSDLVDFRVHKSVLAMVSPIFRDTLSLPQPSDSEIVDGLPMIQISEDSELLNCLLSILYPIPTVIPSSYKEVLHLFFYLS